MYMYIIKTLLSQIINIIYVYSDLYTSIYTTLKLGPILGVKRQRKQMPLIFSSFCHNRSSLRHLWIFILGWRKK